MDDNTKQFKTPSYILKEVHNYNKKNSEIINLKAREKYAKHKQDKTHKQPSKYSLMTPEAKETYKAKQRAYYQSRKLKQQQLLTTDTEDSTKL